MTEHYADDVPVRVSPFARDLVLRRGQFGSGGGGDRTSAQEAEHAALSPDQKGAYDAAKSAGASHDDAASSFPA